MKTQTFQWQWNDGPVYPDVSMTRERAAKLLSAWRRQARCKANYKNVIDCKRLAHGVYRVVSSHGESGCMIVGTIMAGQLVKA